MSALPHRRTPGALADRMRRNYFQTVDDLLNPPAWLLICTHYNCRITSWILMCNRADGYNPRHEVCTQRTTWMFSCRAHRAPPGCFLMTYTHKVRWLHFEGDSACTLTGQTMHNHAGWASILLWELGIVLWKPNQQITRRRRKELAHTLCSWTAATGTRSQL